MRRLSNQLTSMALGLVVLGGGQLAARYAVAQESAWPPKTLPGTATARSIGSALKGGMTKVGEALIPAPSVKGEPDPISLSTKARRSPELYLSMAAMAEESGNVTGAHKNYQQALELAPKRIDSILQYARFRDRHGELAEATGLYQQAARLNPDEPSVFNDLGLCFARRNMLPQSLSALDRAIQLAPDRRLYRNNIATVLVQQGDVDAAFGHLKVVHDEAVAYYNLGYLMLNKGESKAAARLFSEALAKNQSLVEARVWLRKLQGNKAEPHNAQRKAPQSPKATGHARRPAGTPELSMRPSQGRTTVKAVGSGQDPAHSAPLPKRAAVPDRSWPSSPEIRLSAPVRSTTPGSALQKPVPVFQPLPPIQQ